MKRVLFFVLLFIILCSFSSALCKGELGDQDAFSTYIGKTRTEVRRIAPMFDEFADNMYLVDWIEEGDDFIGLAVMFDDFNLVESVLVIVTKGAMKLLDIDDSLEMAAYLGAVNFGFAGKDTLKAETNKDGNYVISIKGGITIIATEMSDQLYAVMCMQK